MPLTQLRSIPSGATDFANTDRGRATVTRSNGITYSALYCSDLKIHIFEISADKLTVTDRIQITPSSGEAPLRITLGLVQSTNNLAIAYQTAYISVNNRVRYAPVNTTTWAAPTWEDATGTAGASSIFTQYDMDVSDTGMVYIVALLATATSMNIVSYSKATSGGAWVQNLNRSLFSGFNRTSIGECISVACLAVSGGVRDIVVAAGSAYSGGGGIQDTGVLLVVTRCTETTGALVGAAAGTNSITYMTATAGVSADYRHVKLFRVGASSYDFAGMARATKNTYYARGSYTAGTWANIMNQSSNSWSSKSWSSNLGIAAGSVTQATTGQGVTFYLKDVDAVLWTKTVYAVSTSVVWAGGDGRAFPNVSTQTVYTVSDNQCIFPTITDHDIVITVFDSVAATQVTYDAWTGWPAVMPGGNTGITSLTPASGAINISGNPSLVAVVDIDQKYSSGVVQVEFQFASDAGFTTSVNTYRQPVSKAVYINGTDTPGVVITVSDVMPTTLAKATWFYRARLIDQWSNAGAWFSGGSFTVGHPPAAVPVTPLAGSLYAWQGGIRTFSWNFTDPSPGDVQTAYQVQIIDSTGATVQDSGKVISTSLSYTCTALAVGLKDTNITWQVRLWDSTDTPGVYCTPQQFILTDLPVATITSPTGGSTITTGAPTLSASVTDGGSPTRRIKGYQISVTSGANTVYYGPVIPVDIASGGTITAKMPPNYLQNNLSYTVTMTIVDSAPISAVSAPVSFSTAWTPPATPGAVTVDITGFDVESSGYNLVQWPDTGRATGFTHWTIYRQDDLIDPVSGTVIQAGTPKALYQNYDTGTSYVYRDYLAPANQYQSIYSVSQWINANGQDIESLLSSAAAVKQQSSAYWLTNVDSDTNTASTMRLSIVTDDSFTEEQEEQEFTVVGRGRIVNRGQYLGPKGSITAQLRNTGGTTARQKRLALMTLLAQSGELLLSNPFGDIWSVNMSNVGVSRISGVGPTEFCDVTIPYAEVS